MHYCMSQECSGVLNCTMNTMHVAYVEVYAVQLFLSGGSGFNSFFSFFPFPFFLPLSQFSPLPLFPFILIFPFLPDILPFLSVFPLLFPSLFFSINVIDINFSE